MFISNWTVWRTIQGVPAPVILKSDEPDSSVDRFEIAAISFEQKCFKTKSDWKARNVSFLWAKKP